MQRVAIGRAIIHRPPLILADEPTGNLDSKNGALILDLIRAIHESLRPTIVMATHSERGRGVRRLRRRRDRWTAEPLMSERGRCRLLQRARSLRPLLREKTRTALTILGIAVGVAVVVAIQLANQSALRAFRESVDAIAGRANYQIVGDAGPLDERVLLGCGRSGTKACASRRSSTSRGCVEPAQQPVRMLAVDLLSAISTSATTATRASRPARSTSRSAITSTLFQPDSVVVPAPFAREHGLRHRQPR